ncbi:putative membrane protein [Actinokineospora diospyrosa]|uniref:Membrane protein n=1 Tax=Actinokineospora diospyrosa TaxID=103728 RepID=A0ABT1I8Y7_9PSEU|nr:putative membrane protein [Actinokineospora diospyrosa]
MDRSAIGEWTGPAHPGLISSERGRTASLSTVDALDIAAAAAAVGAGLVAGLFFTFSVVVMPALAPLPAEVGVATMRSVNRVIINPLFLVLFLGTGVLGVLAALAGPWPRVLGAALYLVGAFVVTGVRNVPWNTELDGLTPGTAEAAEYWPGYLRRWTAWNHVRTVASTGAAVAFVVG